MLHHWNGMRLNEIFSVYGTSSTLILLCVLHSVDDDDAANDKFQVVVGRATMATR